MLSAELNRSRRLGLEFEFSIPMVGTGTPGQVQAMIAQVLTENGLPSYSRNYSHEPVDPRYLFVVERDSSVQGENLYRGVTWVPVELKTRPLCYDEYEQHVGEALRICSYLGGRATPSTGGHVHLEVREFLDNPKVVRSLYNWWRRFENVLYGLVPPSRRACGYARPLPERLGLFNSCKTHQCVRRVLHEAGDRYTALNLTHLFDPGGPRIEVRLAAGTLDPIKSMHWVRFCLAVVEHCVTRTCQATPTLPNDRRSLDRLFVSTGFLVNSKCYRKVAPELRETANYLLRKRWRRFNVPNERANSDNSSTTTSVVGVV